MRGSERSNQGLTRIALFSAIVISTVLISFQRGGERNSSGLEVATQETIAPIAQFSSVPVRRLEAFLAGFGERRSLEEVNEELREDIATLRERQARYDNLAFKVARYEAILGVDIETDVPLKKIAGRAIGETDGPFVRSFLINVGVGDDVAIGNPVLSTDGLVGHIINVGQNTSRVLRLSDLNSRIAVASARSGATAILAGDNKSDPKLSFINQRENWRVGDQVITSGDDGSLPRGLGIGVVIQDKTGGLRVELFGQSASLDWVWVSPYQKITAPREVESDLDGGL